MSIAGLIKTRLIKENFTYDLLTHAHTQSLEQAAAVLQIPQRMIARAILLSDGDQTIMAVLPLNHVLDFHALQEFSGSGRLSPLPLEQVSAILKDCEYGSVPPLGHFYGIATYIDESLYSLTTVIFEAGSHESLVCLNHHDFERITESCARHRFAQPVDMLRQNEEATELVLAPVDNFMPDSQIAEHVRDLYELPAMPATALALLEVRDDINSTVQDLVNVLEGDPSMAAQIMRYARSPFFGFRGELNSVQEAVSRALGFDMVINLALGLSALKPFRIPPDGPLGMNAFWRHASFSAALAQRLGKHLPDIIKLKPGLLYLSGLLHNFGLILFGHLFPSEYFLLNKLVSINPGLPLTALEKQVLGMGHARDLMEVGHATVGSWLMEFWNMPEEVITVTRHHHNEQYSGEHAAYVQVICLTNYLLKQHNIGDAPDTTIPAHLLESLSLDGDEIQIIGKEFVDSCAGIDLGLTSVA